MRLRSALTALFLALAAAAARAEDVVAVLSSDLKPYREAYDAFVAARGRPVPLLALGEPPPKDAKVVVAFGGKAASQRWPSRVALVFGVAPGLSVGPETHDGDTVKVMMEPRAEVVLDHLLALQPGLKRLAVLWASPGHADAARILKEKAAVRGVTVLTDGLSSADDLPRALRALKGRVDALWVTPDPVIVNARSFELIKAFSYDSKIPFYVAAEALAERGAMAAVFIDYSDAGRAANAAVEEVLAGPADGERYAGAARLAVNRAAAKEVGLALPPEALKSATKVLP